MRPTRHITCVYLKRETQAPKKGGTDNMLKCTNNQNVAKGELQRAHQRLLDALHGIPVQFRTGDMSSVISEMEECDIDSVEAIKAHAQHAIDMVNTTPIQYITNKAVDAARHYEECLSAI